MYRHPKLAPRLILFTNQSDQEADVLTENLYYIVIGEPKLDRKGNRAFADLRYGEEDTSSPSTQIFAATKG